MGLDINFFKTNKSNWKRYQEECHKFANLSDEEKEKGYHGTEAPNYQFDPEEIGYFRKVNFLMRFFNYTGNCEYKEIKRDELEDLKNKCLALATIKPKRVEISGNTLTGLTGPVTRTLSQKDQELCAKLLPTTSGFFFGSTDYDGYYLDDVKEVFVWVCRVLENLKDNEVVLMFCWW